MLPSTILVPTDFSARAEHALDYACALAEKLGATVHLVHCIGASLPELSVALTDSMIQSLQRDGEQSLEQLVTKRPGIKFGKRTVLPGDARDGILANATALGADLIVMGTHGRRGIKRLVLGSVAEHVVRLASCPVLTLHSQDAA
jgi:nucleotide-binding universal stress UspA family protein